MDLDFDFINLPKILRSKAMCNNLLSNFDISDIPMVVYNLNLSIRLTLSIYKQLVYFVELLINSLKTL